MNQMTSCNTMHTEMVKKCNICFQIILIKKETQTEINRAVYRVIITNIVMFFRFFYNFNFSSRGKLPLFKDTREFILGTEHQRECNLKVGLVLRWTCTVCEKLCSNHML